MNHNRRMISYFIILFILLNIVFCSNYIMKYAHHNCQNERCPICVELDYTIQSLTEVKLLLSSSFLGMAMCFMMTRVFLANNQSSFNHTLVSLKVELLI